ncbi:MAG: cob(I)yrinic acid a,c-diamide adenosyltransferase [Minisyncoccales bacterium]
MGQGDQGKTDLLSGKKVAKSALIIEILGELDELSAFLDLIISKKPQIKIQKILEEISKNLTDIAAHLAQEKDLDLSQTVKKFESLIVDIESKLKPLHEFVHFQRNEKAAFINIARTISRRAERKVFQMKKPPLEIGKYLNRLSRLLFTLARRQKEA